MYGTPQKKNETLEAILGFFALGIVIFLFVIKCTGPEEEWDPSKTSNEYNSTTDIKKISWMEKGQGAVRLSLKDGNSAQFKNVVFRYNEGVPITCGNVNSKNSYGAYSGYQRFVTGGSIQTTFLEEQVKDFSGVWSELCK